MKIKEAIFDTLLPRRCIGCKKEGQYICDKCELFLSEAQNNLINEKLISIWEYEGIIEKLIWKIKYDGMYHAIDELVEKAFRVIAKDTLRFQSFLEFLLSPDTYITYVPMYEKKEKQRGFNQAEFIARKIDFLLNLVKQRPFRVVPLLTKIKDNKSQVGLNPAERIENVKNAFLLNLVKQEVGRAVLVDDVYTTGATVNECCRILKKGGVKDIWVFTLSRKLTI